MQINLLRINVVMGKKEFRQRYRLIGRGLAPVVQLRGEDPGSVINKAYGFVPS